MEALCRNSFQIRPAQRRYVMRYKPSCTFYKTGLFSRTVLGEPARAYAHGEVTDD